MELTNRLPINPITGTPYTQIALKKDKYGCGMPITDDDGVQKRDGAGNLLWKAEPRDWCFFEMVLGEIGKAKVSGWNAGDFAIWSRLSSKLREEMESDKPFGNQLVKVKIETLEWVKTRLQEALTQDETVDANMAAVLFGILEGDDGTNEDEV